jgi:hypothetical protein
MSTDVTVITPSYSSQNYFVANINELNEKPFQDYNDSTEAFQNFILDEAERLYDKLIDDSLNKVGSEPNNSSINASPSIEPFIARSDNKSSPSSQKIAAFTYRKEEEERIFIESESESENMKQDEYRTKQKLR